MYIMSDDEFSDIEYNEELEQALQQAEQVVDIEDMLSPFKQFRKKGWLSVSDLVGTVWCEVQVSRNEDELMAV
jgi:exonuclease V